jgi:hypothetical protein
MIEFFPIWKTPSGNLASGSEGSTISSVLHAERVATFMGAPGQTVIDIDPSEDVANVTLKVNTATLVNPTNYTIVSNTIVLSNALTTTDIVEVIAEQPITYTMLYNSLPPGITFSNSGTISGTIGTLPVVSNALVYPFAVRASDNLNSVDREFSVTASSATVILVPPSWNLPSQSFFGPDDERYAYVPLGRATRGDTFEYQLQVYNNGGPNPTFILEHFISLDEVVAPFDYLPHNVVLNPSTGLLSGDVDPSNQLGNYYFQIRLEVNGTPVANSTRIFGIEIAPPVDVLEPLRFIRWVTPAGDIGTFYEQQPCSASVLATCTTGEAVSYALHSSSVLPPGITLNTFTGDLEGKFSHIALTKTYIFRIRAYVGDTYEDRTFSMTVQPRYNSAYLSEVMFNLRVKEIRPMYEYYSSRIDPTYYFRSTDENFGTVGRDLNIYIVSGIRGDIDEMRTTIQNSPYGGPITVQLGAHKIAYAKQNGVTIYEVLYRDVIDPIAKAGGFKVINKVPVAEPLRYPQSVAPPTYIHPSSIKNIRYDFITKIGFPAIDPSQEFVPGNPVVENMPLWMSSPQTSATNSALGYIPAVALAYLKPGTGQAVLDQIKLNPPVQSTELEPGNPIVYGHQVDFDQYYVVFQTVAFPTTFDENTTTFDNGLTNFDTFGFDEGKYYRINPKLSGGSLT